MRLFLKIVFAIITASIVIWMTAGDLITHYAGILPNNALEFKHTNYSVHIHFTQKATLAALIWWLVVLIGGWKLKRWGRRQLQLGIALAIPAMLPLQPFLGLGKSCCSRMLDLGNWNNVLTGLVGIILIAIILTAKLLIWRYWYHLTINRPISQKLRTND